MMLATTPFAWSAWRAKVRAAGGNAVEMILEAAGGEKFDVALTANSVKSTQDAALKLVRKKARC